MAQVSERAGGVRRRADPGSQGARGGAQAAGHVHRLDVRARTAPPRLRGGRQLDRRSARRLRGQRSTSRSTRTTRSRSRTTGAAFRSTCTRRRRCRASSSRSPCCTPAASSTRTATRCRADCTASACRVVNALSEQLKVWVKRDGQEHYMDFARGDTTTKLKVLRDVPKRETGTKIWFKPDHDDLHRCSSTTTTRSRCGCASCRS